MIAAAAIRDKRGVFTLPPPNRHHHILHAFDAVGPHEQGFITDGGKFVSRRKALGIAIANGQIGKLPGKTELFSEDLW